MKGRSSTTQKEKMKDTKKREIKIKRKRRKRKKKKKKREKTKAKTLKNEKNRKTIQTKGKRKGKRSGKRKRKKKKNKNKKVKIKEKKRKRNWCGCSTLNYHQQPCPRAQSDTQAASTHTRAVFWHLLACLWQIGSFFGIFGGCADWFRPLDRRRWSWIKWWSVSWLRRHVEKMLPKKPGLGQRRRVVVRKWRCFFIRFSRAQCGEPCVECHRAKLVRIGNLRGWLRAATLPRMCCARKCMRPGSRVAAAKDPFVTARKAFLSSWTGCDNKGEGMWWEKLKWQAEVVKNVRKEVS